MEPPLLATLDEAERRAVLAQARRRRFAKGEVLFHEGDLGDALHLLVKGRVAIRVTTPLGEVATLSILGGGAAFGELALLAPDSRRTATAVALEATETLALGRTAFEGLRSRHPAVERAVVDGLAASVARLSAQLLEALYLPADRRVVRRLLGLVEVYGPVVPLTQEELAQLAGTTRPTVNRVLRDAEAAGLVALGRGRVEVRDPEGLRRRG